MGIIMSKMIMELNNEPYGYTKMGISVMKVKY